MNAVPVYLGSGWVATAEGGMHPYRATMTATTTKDDWGEPSTTVVFSAHIVKFPTMKECEMWLAGARPSTSAPTLYAVTWATSMHEAIAKFRAELQEAEA